MGAKKLSGLLVEDHFDQPLILTERDRLAVADEGEPPDANLQLLVLRRLFGKTDRRDLRRAIGAARDHPLVHRMRIQALDTFDANDAFMLGLMGEQGRPGDVADSIDTRHTGLAKAVDHNRAAISLDTEFFETKIFDIADDADRGDDAIDGQRLRTALAVIDGRGNAV